ncbi:MAG: Gfo/Idh/MocA family oxidoreductase [Planctomycetales bacterium]|nr:Gfo/Idh/MocA family oxidoreductase [Planctomycetales bacterium]
MTTLRWGVIGAGRFGLIHARTIRSLSKCRLAALCNDNADRLDAARAEFPDVTAYGDYRELLADASIDVVSITTHWREHAAVAIDALAAGKHVLLEKPLASSVEECRRVLDAASGSTGKLLVGHICRFDPRVALAKQAIDSGRIGRIVSMHAKRNLPRAPGHIRLDKISPLMGDGIHDADLMMWFLGRAPSRVFAREVRVDQFRYADVGWAMLEFGSDAIGVVETNWRLPENTPTVIDARMEVIGTDGSLTIDCSATGLSVLDGAGLKSLDTDYWPTVFGQPTGVLRSEIEYFAECIRHDRPVEIITPAEAARAVAVMQAAEESAAKGQPVEFV